MLFQVSNPQEKLNTIIQIVQTCFNEREPLLIRLPNHTALEYVDTLLWRSPRDSFLPHVAIDEACRELILLTLSENNFNCAHTILNLCAQPIVNKDLLFTRIYEFEDLSNDRKNKLQQECYQSYKKRGYSIQISS